MIVMNEGEWGKKVLGFLLKVIMLVLFIDVIIFM